MEIHLNQPYSFIQLGRRANQEDARFPDEDMPQAGNATFVVCDGVGGQDCGEVASRTVAEAIGKYMHGFSIAGDFLPSDFIRLMDYVYSRLNSKVSARASTNMATTMAFVCVNKTGVFCAHIGDSRIYHIRPGVGILYQSEDHSLVNALVHSGNLTPEEAINHPQSNIITRCITPKQPTNASVIQLQDIEAGDYIFLCTDGVVHQIDNAGLCEILASRSSDADKMRYIADICSGSSDNNTAYLIRVKDVVYDAEEEADISSGKRETAQSDTSITVPVTSDRDTAMDVPVPATHNKKSFLSFIKNIFNK